ncbi:MAG: hypothetical protein GY901_12270 [Actinomycetia bacterium]|nr:hypothetical protein [Actinomycetes bacterium]
MGSSPARGASKHGRNTEVEVQSARGPVGHGAGCVHHLEADPVTAHDHDPRHAHAPCVRTRKPSKDGDQRPDPVRVARRGEG